MTLNPNRDEPSEDYLTIKAIWERFISGKPLDDLDRFVYYDAKSRMLNQRIRYATDKDRTKNLVKKHISASREAQRIHSLLSTSRVEQDESLVRHCVSTLEVMGPELTSKFWGS